MHEHRRKEPPQFAVPDLGQAAQAGAYSSGDIVLGYVQPKNRLGVGAEPREQRHRRADGNQYRRDDADSADATRKDFARVVKSLSGRFVLRLLAQPPRARILGRARIFGISGILPITPQ